MNPERRSRVWYRFVGLASVNAFCGGSVVPLEPTSRGMGPESLWSCGSSCAEGTSTAIGTISMSCWDAITYGRKATRLNQSHPQADITRFRCQDAKTSY